MEQQWKEMEFLVDQYQKELMMNMEQQHQELTTFIDNFISVIIG